MASWTEQYSGGSPEAERLEFEQLAQLMMAAQLKSRKEGHLPSVTRAFHARAIAARAGAQLKFTADLPKDLTVGFARPGATYPCQVRLSNAASIPGADTDKDLRGLAVRVAVPEKEHHDLLATNWPVPHARDARQFVLFAHALAGGSVSKAVGLVRLVFQLGFSETRRMLANVREARRVCDSLALETYWSRGAIRWGDQAVRFFFSPVDAPPVAGSFEGPGRLEAEFGARQAAGDIAFDLYLQRFVDERQTPIEDAAHEWSGSASPPVRVATLTLPRRYTGDAEAEAESERRVIEGMGFNPWNTTDEFRPLGNLNRARKAIYDASAAHRQGLRWKAPQPPLRNRLIGGSLRNILRRVNRTRPWHKLPLWLSLLNLDALRDDLRAWNLHDTEPREAPPQTRSVPGEIGQDQRLYRTWNGSYNDLSDPKMGSVGATFGRNMAVAPRDVDEPNAVTVCRELMDRKAFIPVRGLNMLAAAWIQFQVHDWVNHARFPFGKQDLVVPVPDKYPDWNSKPHGKAGREMHIAGDIPYGDGADPTLFANNTSHWWDGSEVYGSDPKKAESLREGAKIRLTSEGYLPTDVNGMEITGFNESWWMGLSIMHTLFVREHNVLCDELRRVNPYWSDERVYQTARLIVSALIARIHTIEWTPGILATEALDIGMHTNWSGPPAHDWLTRLGVWLTDAHALKGIPQTFPDHHSAPYSLTEEFVTVYRLHPLIPDEFVFHDLRTGKELSRKGFLDIQGKGADDVLREVGMHDALYSFGISYPGAITLHNFPKSLQRFQRNGEIIDLSVVDIMRTRIRQVPRYNAFRRELRMPSVTRFEDMTASVETNRILREVYRDVEKVDTVIGLLGETPPDGFGFSDTAFRIFILMASRRLQSDRFLNVDFRPEIYSPFGIDWIQQNGMASVILRHCPELAAVIPRGSNPFAPWRQIA
jgi:hypothetical protein